MQEHPRPEVEVVLNPPEVETGYDKPVTITARVTNTEPNVHYWFLFKQTSGRIHENQVWGKREKGAVVATAQWQVHNIEPEEASVEVEVRVFPKRNVEEDWLVNGSDAAILVIREGVDVVLELERGEDCGDYTTVRQGELICFKGTIRSKGLRPGTKWKPRVYVPDGPEFDISFIDANHFEASLFADELDRGYVTVVAEVDVEQSTRDRRDHDRVRDHNRDVRGDDDDDDKPSVLTEPVRADAAGRTPRPIEGA
jgi:hypothetical protein